MKSKKAVLKFQFIYLTQYPTTRPQEHGGTSSGARDNNKQRNSSPPPSRKNVLASRKDGGNLLFFSSKGNLEPLKLLLLYSVPVLVGWVAQLVARERGVSPQVPDPLRYTHGSLRRFSTSAHAAQTPADVGRETITSSPNRISPRRRRPCTARTWSSCSFKSGRLTNAASGALQRGPRHEGRAARQ
eukprot:scaffold27812_cov31-Tisochrysis_lutea.AAC.1